MNPLSNLNELVRNMKPVLHPEKYIFCTFPNMSEKLAEFNPVLTFRETEGVTCIITKDTADKNTITYQSVYRMLTLNVHSDLNAVGFIAAVTNELARNNISVNPVSAFYHDHLFVSDEQAESALNILIFFSSNNTIQ